MIQRFRKVTSNLYRGSAPSPVDVVSLKNKLGIKKIVSLDLLSGQNINKVAKNLGIEHIIIPINGDRKSLLKLFHYNLKKLLLEHGPTFVHCAAGKDRTGLVVAIVKCKYLHEDPEKAIEEAKSFGFGVGIDPQITQLYEKLIRCCKSSTDSNNADIVSNERKNIGDGRDSILDESTRSSFAPTRSYPADKIYNEVNEQSPTRENYTTNKSIKINETSGVPLVGQLNSNTGGRGAGVTENSGSFFSD